MAITFTKDLPSDKVLMAYNNNVVRFSSNNPARYCTITGLGLDIRLYPDPNGMFYFNFLEYSSAIVNTKKFVDDLVTDILAGDSDSLAYDVTDGCFIEGQLTFTITMLDDSTESVNRTVQFLAGVFQLEDFKRMEIPNDSDFAILSPVASRTNNTSYLKYWEGYPFEFSFYSASPGGQFKIKNLINGLDYDFTAKAKVTSIFLSDGRTEITLEDFLPLVVGHNRLLVVLDGDDMKYTIHLDKVDTECGVYVKWLNQQGRWNYWLLNKTSFRDRSSKYDTEIENDFHNLEDTFAPTVQSGKSTEDVLKCNVKGLSPEHKDVLTGILESPKIYYFTGERFSRAGVNDWVEVRLKTGQLRVDDSEKQTFKFNLDFDLPKRYAQFL